MAIQTTQVSFWIPIGSPSSSIAKMAESYLWFGGRVAEVVIPVQMEGDSQTAWKSKEDLCVGCIAFRIITMIASLGILPLIALIIKAVYRCNNQFHWIDGDQDKSTELRGMWAWGNRPDPSRSIESLRDENEQISLAIQEYIDAGEDPFHQRLKLWKNNINIESLLRLEKINQSKRIPA